MARIAGVEIPDNKRVEISLTYIFGIGRSKSQKILEQAKVDKNKRVKELKAEELNTIRMIIEKEEKVEGDLRKEIQMSIKRLMEINCYRDSATEWVFLYVDREPKPTLGPGRDLGVL